MKLDWKALSAARTRAETRQAEEAAAREQWLQTVDAVAAVLDGAGWETGRVIDTGGAWPERFTVKIPYGEPVAVHVTRGLGDVQNLVAQEIRDCRVRVAEDLLARFCKAGEPVPQPVADWAMTHGVAPGDCPRCRNGEPQDYG